MPNSHKVDRVAESIRRALPHLLRGLKDPRIHGMLSVVRVDVSGDLSVAKIYVSCVEGIEAARESVKGLQSATGLLRREITAELGLKKAPELRFIADDSIAHSAHIAEILRASEGGGQAQ